MNYISIIFKLCVLGYAVFIAGILTSCSTDGSEDVTPDPTVSGTTWVVSYYFDQDKEETDDFTGYEFSFNEDGKAIASKNGSITEGTWSIINDDGHRKFVLNLGLTEPLEELNDDWIITEETANSLKLMDDNDTHLEELHFSAK